MSVIQSLLGGPLLLAIKSADNPEQGVATTLHESDYVRGDVVEFMKAGLIASVAEVKENSLSNLSGGLANAGLVADADDGFFAVVNSRTPTPDGYKAPLVVQGQCVVNVFLEDVSGDSEAVSEGDKIYAVEGETYVTMNPALTGATVGRAVGVVLETIAEGGRVTDSPNPIRCWLNGIPPHIA